MVSLESEDRTIEALWEADGGVMNQHPPSCLLPVDIPPGNKNKIIFQQKKEFTQCHGLQMLSTERDEVESAHLRDAAGRDLEDEQFATRMSPVW